MTIATGNYNVDPSHSEIGFTVRHAGISKVRGRFHGVSGVVTVNEGGTATVHATVDANTFDSGSEDRDNHIKSADFLDVTVFPELVFVGNYAEADGKLVGDLSIHGVTKTVEFDVEVTDSAIDPFGNTRVGAEASTTISRKDFGLTWNAALETGGVLVSDKVKIELDLSFIKEN